MKDIFLKNTGKWFVLDLCSSAVGGHVATDTKRGRACPWKIRWFLYIRLIHPQHPVFIVPYLVALLGVLVTGNVHCQQSFVAGNMHGAKGMCRPYGMWISVDLYKVCGGIIYVVACMKERGRGGRREREREYDVLYCSHTRASRQTILNHSSPDLDSWTSHQFAVYSLRSPDPT